MELVTINLPENVIEALDELVGKDKYRSRSEAIRFAVRDFLKDKDVWPKIEVSKDLMDRINNEPIG